MRRVWTIAAIPAAVVALTGCPPSSNQAEHSSMGDGATSIGKKDAGIWNGKGGPTCRWWVQTPKGTITNNGNTIKKGNRRIQNPKNSHAKQSQSVIFSTGDAGNILKSDNCGPWTR